MFLSMTTLDKLFVLIALILFHLSEILVQIWNIKVMNWDKSSCDDTQQKINIFLTTVLKNSLIKC